jgi:hypothetical protein
MRRAVVAACKRPANVPARYRRPKMNVRFREKRLQLSMTHMGAKRKDRKWPEAEWPLWSEIVGKLPFARP